MAVDFNGIFYSTFIAYRGLWECLQMRVKGLAGIYFWMAYTSICWHERIFDFSDVFWTHK